MAAIPESMHAHSTARAIFRIYEERQAQETPRPYLGASIIGRPCDRALWYQFRQVAIKAFDGRMLRLFDTGHRAEPRFVEELRALGATVWEVDPATGEQFEVGAVNGHFSGHADGVAKGLPEAPKTPAVLEFKTHSAKSFADLVKNGVEKSKPDHWAQVHVYGHKLGLERALYLSVNKDTDDLYSEWIHVDKAVAQKYLDRAERIIEAKEPPPRMNDDPAFYLCKFCDFHAVCHGDAPPRKNCRTCVNATPCRDREGGKWTCDKPGWNNVEIPFDVQLKGCEEHVFIPSLIKYGEPVDAGDGWIEYQHRDTGERFINAGAEAMADPDLKDSAEHFYSSDELAISMPAFVTDPTIASIKKHFPGAEIKEVRPVEKQPTLI